MSDGDLGGGLGLRVGAEVGPYLIRGLLGRGGMGAVYDALHTGLQRPVALKTLLGSEGSSDEIQRFLLEAQALGRLDHPHVVRLYDAGQHQGLRYIAMEKVEGQSLAQLLEEGPLPAEEAARILAGLCEGVSAAHVLGILHRDLKPENVLLTHEGVPRLTDFGLAKIERQRLTETGEVLGTPNFMAPEQARGERARQGPWTDVYGLGCVLYACLTGAAPYAEQHGALAILGAVDDGPPRPVRQLAPQVPPNLQAIVALAMAREPEHRYPSAAALRLDLERFLRGEAVEARPLGRGARAWRRARREFALLSASAIGTGILCVGLALAAEPYLQGPSEREEGQRATAWREGELARLGRDLPQEPTAIRKRLAELSAGALRERALVALEPEGAPLSLGAERGLGGREGLDAASATLRARLYAALGAAEGGSASGAAALTSAVVLAPSSPAGRAARLDLGRRLRLHASGAPDESGRSPEVRGAASRDARGAALALLEPLARAAGKNPADTRGAARAELAWLRAGQLRFDEALRLAGEGQPVLSRLSRGWARSEALPLEDGETLHSWLKCGMVFSGPRGARLVRPDGSQRRFAPPPEAKGLLIAGWGPLRDPSAPELHLVWSGPRLQWRSHDLAARDSDVHAVWRGRPPRGSRSRVFGDFDGDGRLDLALLGWAGVEDSCVISAGEGGGARLQLIWKGSRGADEKRVPRPWPAGTGVSLSDVQAFQFGQILALDLVSEVGAPPRDELVLTPSELAPVSAVLVLGQRGPAAGFVCLADIPHGPVAKASVGQLDGKEVALLTIDRQAGAPGYRLGSLEQEGHSVLGAEGAGPRLLARWIYPGDVGDRVRHARRGLSAWLTEIEGSLHLVRGQEALAGGYCLEGTPLAGLKVAAEGPAATPTWLLHLPGAPGAPRLFPEQQAALWGQRSYRRGRPSREHEGPEPVSSLSETSTPERLAWAVRALEALGHEAEATSYADELRSRYPEANATRDREWSRLQRSWRSGLEAEAEADEAFSALLSASGREAWARAEASYLETARAAEASAQESSPWAPPPGAAWELASLAWFALGERERGLAAAEAGSKAPGAARTLVDRLEEQRRRWEPVARWKRLELPLDLAAPGALALGSGVERDTWPVPGPEPSNQPALRVRASAELRDGFLVPCSAAAGVWRLEAEFEVQGSAWCAELDLGLFRAEPEGPPGRCTGLRFGFWDVYTRRLNIAPSVEGKVFAGQRVSWPTYQGRISVSVEVSADPGGGTRFRWELRDGAGRVAFRRVETLAQSLELSRDREALYLGLVSGPSRNTKDSSAENNYFGHESALLLRRLAVQAPEARFDPVQPAPRELLWQGHAALARGESDGALRLYAKALAILDHRPPGLERVTYELSPAEADLRWEALWWHGVARSGSGDADGWRDLETCLRARPDRALATLEALGGQAPRGPARSSAAALLDALAEDSDPLVKAIATRMRDGDLRELKASWVGQDSVRERAFLRLQCVQAAALGRRDLQQTLRSALRAWEPGVHPPRLFFPRVLRPGKLPEGLTFAAACRPSESAQARGGRGAYMRDLGRAQILIAAKPAAPGGHLLAALTYQRLRVRGLACDAAHDVLRRQPSPVQKSAALQILASQAARLRDLRALWHWAEQLRALGVSEDQLAKLCGGEVRPPPKDE